jgi:hypothetical protein
MKCSVSFMRDSELKQSPSYYYPVKNIIILLIERQSKLGAFQAGSACSPASFLTLIFSRSLFFCSSACVCEPGIAKSDDDNEQRYDYTHHS